MTASSPVSSWSAGLGKSNSSRLGKRLGRRVWRSHTAEGTRRILPTTGTAAEQKLPLWDREGTCISDESTEVGFSPDGKDLLAPDTPSFLPTPEQEAETRALALHSDEALLRRSPKSPLVTELPALLEEMPDDAVLRVRAALDACLVFRQDGTAADLRSVVFELMPEPDRRRVIRRIRSACSAIDRTRPGFVILSDVDDTLLPARDMLQISGCDRSWHLDGRLYPGASKTHKELRNGLRDAHGGDYSVLLTARPPFMVKSLVGKLRRITGSQSAPRMSILPGMGGVGNAAMTVARNLAGNYARIGEMKLERLREYSTLFPDYCGRFIFIGDDGQADVDVGTSMLTLRVAHPLFGSSTQHLGTPGSPMVAFVAVHAVQQGGLYVVPEAQREALVQATRAAHPAEATDAALPTTGARSPAPRHRFFYFLDYRDLAEQLEEAGWIEPAQCDAIVRAFERDSLPDLATMVESCDLKGLRSGIAAWSHSVDEGDESEKAAFRRAGTSLADVLRVHVKLAPPPTGAIALHLRLVGVRSKDPAHMEGGLPRMQLREQADQTGRSARVLRRLPFASSRKPFQSVSDENCLLRIPWPCTAFSRQGARAVLDISSAYTPRPWGRCYVILDDASGATRDRGTAEAALQSPGKSGQRATGPSEIVGELTLTVHWEMEQDSRAGGPTSLL